jgi:hypothetical protein
LQVLLVHHDHMIEQLAQRPQAPVYIPQPRPLDRALKHSELVAEGKNLSGQLAAPFEESEQREQQGTQDVQLGPP